MRHYASSRHTRLVAVVVVLLWMLVLGSGVANACLPGADHMDAASQAYRPATSSAAVHDRHAVHVDPVAQDTCADCVHRLATDCGIAMPVATVTLAGQRVVEPADPDFHATLVTGWQVHAAVSPDGACAVHRSRDTCPQPIPAYLRFLRLTL